MPKALFAVLAKVHLDAFVYTFVRNLRGVSHIFLHVTGDFNEGRSSYVSTSGNVQATDRCKTLGRAVPALSTAAPANQHDDERTLSISANGAYYLYVLGCARSV
ncbi:hypothetical protein SOP85_13770 [Pseudomonas sp. YuFO20]|jgi:hypothetical protein|uniref:Uncharacterized protein n=1 Tax=Pseudomonas neuropathica TaxID=2730425 RepID=A0ACC7N337_9PSED|nr:MULTISPECIES: hypothetical protein [Pseudomonas]MDD2101538.1 hypothetical protein [Pseudomonas putida]MEB2516498.1 hypothetical protein [Pseudomonas sp. YuFO20]MEB2622261.1 hypothetical protein [Pseudomonas sp. YuFO8]